MTVEPYAIHLMRRAMRAGFRLGLLLGLLLGLAAAALFGLATRARADAQCLTEPQLRAAWGHAYKVRPHCWRRNAQRVPAHIAHAAKPFDPNPYGDPSWADVDVNPHGDPIWSEKAPSDRVAETFGALRRPHEGRHKQ